MGLNKKRIYELITVCNEKNFTARDLPFYGINKDKEFMPTLAATDNLDKRKYKIMTKNRFVFSGMQTGRDMCIRIGLYDFPFDALISPAYTIFEISNECVLPEFFFMIFKSSEMDRYGAFLSDASVRANLDWDVFCNIELELPSIPIQQKYVDVYRGIQKNLDFLNAGQSYIQSTISAVMNSAKASSNERKIGNCIAITEERNVKGIDYEFLGVNKEKVFMPTVATTSNLDSAKYKIIRKNRFVYSGMQTGRDKCIRISLYTDDCPAVVSPAYTTFEIIDESIIPEYFFLLFMNPEMDRLGWFMSDSSVRSNLDWDRFCEIKIPVPDKKFQKDIANFYKAFVKRRNEIEQLQVLQKKICPILIRGAIAEGGKS